MDELIYSKEEILSVLRDINEFVVSLDQMNKVHHEFGEEAWKDEIIDYFQSARVSDRLAQVRSMLSKPFPSEIGPDDMDDLEREMQGVQYWTFKEYLAKKNGKG
ncbi:hypothetical protein [Microbulbifer sp. ZKSA002]|uniref:hypothetical protein n=1 Tax=Microbulbifer sp. ZKSA002 TaxID=3243388 RepID=UPI0040391B2E